MRLLTRLTTATCLLASSLTAVVGLGTGTAHAENCGGFPSIPAAYVCIESLDPQAGLPTVTGGFTVTIPAVCYVIGCTTDQTETVPSVALSQQPVLVFTWNGQTYSVPGNTPVDQVISELNALLTGANTSVYQLCQMVAQKVHELRPGLFLRCDTT